MEILSYPIALPRTPPSLLPLSASNSTFLTIPSASSLSISTGRGSGFCSRHNSCSLVVGVPRTRIERRKRCLSCNALFGLGVPELAVIAGVAVLLFGPKKLPDVGKSLGKTVRSFQQAAKEFESELKKEPDAVTEQSTTEKPVPVTKEEEDDEDVKTTNNGL